MGIRRIVKVKGEPDYVGSFVDDLVDGDGLVNWCKLLTVATVVLVAVAMSNARVRPS